MMTDEEILALPKKTANRAEVDAYYYMDAFYDAMGRIKGDMEKRLKMLPGGVARYEPGIQQDGQAAARAERHV